LLTGGKHDVATENEGARPQSESISRAREHTRRIEFASKLLPTIQVDAALFVAMVTVVLGFERTP